MLSNNSFFCVDFFGQFVSPGLSCPFFFKWSCFWPQMHLALAWHYIGTVLMHLFDMFMPVVSLYGVAFTLTLWSWHNSSFLRTYWFLRNKCWILSKGLWYDKRSQVLGLSFPRYLGALGLTKCIFHATRPNLSSHGSYVLCELSVRVISGSSRPTQCLNTKL